jgi:transcriptional regulator with XRE-family HTH domain
LSQIANMADAGWFLREHRKARGLTLQALAERVGISVGYISDLESGKRRHNSDWIAKFAEALEIDPSELLRLPGGETQRMVPVVGFVGADTGGDRDLHDRPRKRRPCSGPARWG